MSSVVKMQKASYLTIIFLSVITSFVFPQNNTLKFEHVSLEHGLSQSIVNFIIQDHRGFMWFGTNDGLNKYDGYSFSIFKNNSNDAASLGRSEVRTIAEIDSSSIWAGTYGGGLSQFHRRTETFTQYKHDENDPNTLRSNFILSLSADPVRKNVLWIGTEGGGLTRLEILPGSANHGNNGSRNIFTSWNCDPESSLTTTSNSVQCIYADATGIVWLGVVGGGLARFDPETETFKFWANDPSNANSLSNNWINTICDSPEEWQKGSRSLWLGTHGKGLNRFDIETENFTRWAYEADNPASLSNDYINAMFFDKSNVFWIGTDGGGLNIFNPETNIFTRSLNHPAEPSSLSGNIVNSLYEDRSGVLWIGTLGNGINKIQRNRLDATRFFHWKNISGDPTSLSHNDVRAIFEDSTGAIWIGTYGGGLNLFNPADGTFQHWMSTPEDVENTDIDIFYPQVNNIISIFEDSFANLWLGTYGGKILQFDRKKKKFVYWPYAYGINSIDETGLNEKYVLSFHEIRATNKSSLFIGTHGSGLNEMIWDGGTNVLFKYWKYSLENSDGINNNDIRCIFQKDSDVLWLGSGGGGINEFIPGKNSFSYFMNKAGDSTSLSNDFVQIIYKDNSNNIWVGTESGLNQYVSANNTFIHFKEADGLPNDNICGILEDSKGNLWLSSKKGISRFNPQTKVFRNYDIHDGLQSNEFNSGACYKSQSGELYFGGVNGLNGFRPENIIDNPVIPPVVLTDFKIFNRSVPVSQNGETPLQKHISESREIELSYSQNVFSFEFASLDYNSPTKNQYAYMLENFNKDWYYSGSRRFATYTNLDPGRYVFRVKASNNDGGWNETGTSIKIIITPPFWKTWWFRVILLTAILAIIYLIHSYRMSKQLEMDRLRTRIASDLHDDIGATLTKISIHSEIIQTMQNAQKILPSAQKIGSMSREIITTMSDIVWSIDSRNDTIGDLLDRMRDLGVNVFAKDEVSFHFDAEGLDVIKKLKVDLRQNIYLIFKEAINNVAKHARATNVHLKLINSDGAFLMSVKDDGIGFDEEKIRYGNGLKNMKERAKRIGATIEIFHENGTTVELKMKEI